MGGIDVPVNPGGYLCLGEGGVPHLGLVHQAFVVIPPVPSIPVTADVEGAGGGTDRSRGRFRVVQLPVDVGL